MRIFEGKRASYPIAQPSACSCSGLTPTQALQGFAKRRETNVLTNFRSKLDDTLVSADNLLAEQELLDGNLGLHAFRELLEGIDDPVLPLERDDGVVRVPGMEIDVSVGEKRTRSLSFSTQLRRLRTEISAIRN